MVAQRTTVQRSYPGAKTQEGTWRRICSLMPRHTRYVEMFLGTGAILGRKRPAEWEVAFDTNRDVVEAWPRRRHYRPGPIVLAHDALRGLAKLKPHLDADWLVYVDAPYPLDTRGGRQYYEGHEPEPVDPKWHKRLLTLLIDLPCRVMVSSYWHPQYVTILQEWQGWRAESFRQGTRGGVAQEWLWMNYPADVELHDTTYVGRGFRERARIKKKKTRWVKRFSAMPPAERQAIAEALAEVDPRLSLARSA